MPLPVLVEPVQVDVGEQRRDDPALRSAGVVLGRRYDAFYYFDETSPCIRCTPRFPKCTPSRKHFPGMRSPGVSTTANGRSPSWRHVKSAAKDHDKAFEVIAAGQRDIFD